ncbi:MAG TPA: APC family permease [Actinomycetota bacterium]|nr:APC family permease [Actinomycetota bacterium]
MTRPIVLFKRVLVGRQMPSHRLEHTLLSKVLALPVFASDPLSSNAYATEEILLVLVAAAGASATSLVLPIAIPIAIVLAIVVTSYRQTVRAYPSGGGAYIVSRENLGVTPGLVAAGAILTDYVLTVSVSVSAGVFAITSAAPGLADARVPLALGFVAFVTLANLRGVRESGTLFALPTYAFVVSVFTMIGVGLVECVEACPRAAVEHPIEQGAGAVTLLVILRAFSSGSTALTGVEAISDGVQAFRRPRARNAAATLSVMAAITISMFLGISLLAVRSGALPSHQRSVVSQIAEGVFGHGFGFYAVQVTTAGILILAANTAYQDFPRLSAILARDRFMPRQFENRGDRLVFSNGIVVLGLLAAALLIAFDADVSRLIQLYVVGVFTSFTLSQTGMVRRWLRTREPGWRRSIVVNGTGAAATFVVLIVITASKLVHGAWIVIVAIPLLVVLLRAIHRHYARVEAMLRPGTVAATAPTATNRTVVLVTDFDAAAARALGYVRSFRPADLHVVYAGSLPREEAELRWSRMAGPGLPLRTVTGPSQVEAVLAYVRAVPREPGDFVNVVIPELFRRRSLWHAIRQPVTFRLKVRLLAEPQVVVTDVPVVEDRNEHPRSEGRALVPRRTAAVVFIADVHDASLRAVRYARSLQAAETRAVYVSLEPNEDLGELFSRWASSRPEIPLEAVQAPFRDLGAAVLDEVRRATADPGTVASVVIAEYLVPRWRHRILHNNRALFIKRLLLFEPRVILSSVPYRLAADPGRRRSDSGG